MAARAGWTPVVMAMLLVTMVTMTAASLPDCASFIDVVFVVDSSESTLDQPGWPGAAWGGDPLYAWHKQMDFINKVVGHLPVSHDDGALVAMLTFSTSVNRVFSLGQHQDTKSIQAAISQARFVGGNTDVALALAALRQVAARPGARRVVVMVTDGLANRGQDRIAEEAASVKSSAEVFTIALSPEHNVHVLRNVSSQPWERHIMVTEDVMGLDDWTARLLAHRLCMLPDPAPPTCQPRCRECSTQGVCLACHDGYMIKDGNCTACPESCMLCYSPTTCELCNTGWHWDADNGRCKSECEVLLDLAIVVDSSGSIRDKNPKSGGYDNYELLKSFVNQVIDRLEIGMDATRVGLVRFSSRSELMFRMNQYDSKEQMKATITGMKFDGHETNISGAIEVTRKQIFQPEWGDRDAVQNVLLLITDGESNVDANRTQEAAAAARADGTVMFVVGVTELIDTDELKGIASDPDSEHFFSSPEIRYLDSIMAALLKHVCQQ